MSDNPLNITLEDTVIGEWHERDRNSLVLYLKDEDGEAGEPIIEFWDEDYVQAVDDGFIDPRNPHESVFGYASDMGLLNPANRVKRERVPTGWVAVHDELGALLSWKAGPDYIWTGEATSEEIERGAVCFGDEEAAEEFFREDVDREELADNEEFMAHLSFHEVELDITVEGHTRPRRASRDQLARIGVEFPAVTPAA